MISHCGAPQRLEQTCPHFVVVINATLCRTSLIHIVGSMSCVSCGFRFPVHGHRFDCTETPSIRTGSSRGSLLWSWMLRPTCVWDVVSRHGTCVPEMSADISGLIFVGGLLTTRRTKKVEVVLDENPGYKKFLWKRFIQGPFAGPAHDSSVFDSVRLLQQLARNELDLVGGSDIGICRHAQMDEPILRFTLIEQATTLHTLSHSQCDCFHERPSLLQYKTLRRHTNARL